MPLIDKLMNPNQPIGNIDQVVIHTLSIDVKIIRIDKRQVTQSVFKQISEKSIFRYRPSVSQCEVILEGIPWGIVRYTYSKTPQWVDYYLVWQDNKLLYRTPLPYLRDEDKRDKIESKTPWWGCPRCDTTDWGRMRSKNIDDYGNRFDRCRLCNSPCINLLISTENIYGLKFHQWFKRRDIWDNAYSICYPPTIEERKIIFEQCVTHLRTFELLAQLFIAT